MTTARNGYFPGASSQDLHRPHLEEHQALGEPVRVFYVREEDGTLRIVRIEDG